MISLESFAILVLYEGTTKRGSTMSDERDKRFEDKRFEELRSTMSDERDKRFEDKRFEELRSTMSAEAAERDRRLKELRDWLRSKDYAEGLPSRAVPVGFSTLNRGAGLRPRFPITSNPDLKAYLDKVGSGHAIEGTKCMTCRKEPRWHIPDKGDQVLCRTCIIEVAEGRRKAPPIRRNIDYVGRARKSFTFDPNPDEVEKIIDQLMCEAFGQKKERSITFCSFAENDCNLGVLILEGEFNPVTASLKAHHLKLNPGGSLVTRSIIEGETVLPPEEFEVMWNNRGRLIPIDEAHHLFKLRKVEFGK